MKKNRVKAVLTNKDGFSYILVCVIILVSMMVISVLMQYAHVYHTARVHEDDMQLRLDSYVTKEAIENYDAFKQGEPYWKYINEIDLIGGARGVISGTPGRKTGLTVTPIKGKSVGVCVSYTLTVPFELWGRKVADIEIPIEIISKLTERNG